MSSTRVVFLGHRLIRWLVMTFFSPEQYLLTDILLRELAKSTTGRVSAAELAERTHLSLTVIGELLRPLCGQRLLFVVQERPVGSDGRVHAQSKLQDVYYIDYKLLVRFLQYRHSKILERLKQTGNKVDITFICTNPKCPKSTSQCPIKDCDGTLRRIDENFLECTSCNEECLEREMNCMTATCGGRFQKIKVLPTGATRSHWSISGAGTQFGADDAQYAMKCHTCQAQYPWFPGPTPKQWHIAELMDAIRGGGALPCPACAKPLISSSAASGGGSSAEGGAPPRVRKMSPPATQSASGVKQEPWVKQEPGTVVKLEPGVAVKQEPGVGRKRASPDGDKQEQQRAAGERLRVLFNEQLRPVIDLLVQLRAAIQEQDAERHEAFLDDHYDQMAYNASGSAESEEAQQQIIVRILESDDELRPEDLSSEDDDDPEAVARAAEQGTLLDALYAEEQRLAQEMGGDDDDDDDEDEEDEDAAGDLGLSDSDSDAEMYAGAGSPAAGGLSEEQLLARRRAAEQALAARKRAERRRRLKRLRLRQRRERQLLLMKELPLPWEEDTQQRRQLVEAHMAQRGRAEARRRAMRVRRTERDEFRVRFREFAAQLKEAHQRALEQRVAAKRRLEALGYRLVPHERMQLEQAKQAPPGGSLGAAGVAGNGVAKIEGVKQEPGAAAGVKAEFKSGSPPVVPAKAAAGGPVLLCQGRRRSRVDLVADAGTALPLDPCCCRPPEGGELPRLGPFGAASGAGEAESAESVRVRARGRWVSLACLTAQDLDRMDEAEWQDYCARAQQESLRDLE